jgi:hypothetical protein
LYFYQDNSIFNLKTGEHNKLKRDLIGDTYLSDIYPVNGRNLLIRRPVESIRTQDLVLVELPSYKENKKVPYATQQREPPPPTSEFWSRPSSEFGFEISNDRRILAYSFDYVLVCRRTKDLDVLWTKRINPPLRAYSISISPNGNYLAAILTNAIYKPMRKEYYIAVYDGNTGAEIARIPLADASDYTVSPNGRLLAFSESKYDKAKDEWVVNIQIYELPTCRKLISIQYDSIKNSSLSFLERGLSIDFTPDCRYMITCGNGITKIWELRGGVAKTEITPHNISSK